ncbi:MAG: transposase [Candidatus Hydrothermarchaeales archaeon]
MTRKAGYYKNYERAGINTNRFLARAARRVVRRLGPPFKAYKRGRKLSLEPEKAGVVVIVQAAQNKTFRSAEDVAAQLYKRVDHVTIWRYFRRIRTGWVKHAVSLLYNMIHIQLKKTRIYMLDSTCFLCVRSGVLLKLHVLVSYFVDLGLLVIARAEATLFYRHDAPVAERLLETATGDGEPLLGDRGYDSKGLRRKARRQGFAPNIKFRRQSEPTTQEQAHGVGFDEEGYRMRGVVEGLFGGSEVRYGNETRCRLTSHRLKDVLLKALSFNLRAYLRAQAGFLSTIKRRSFYLLRGIMKQPRIWEIVFIVRLNQIK